MHDRGLFKIYALDTLQIVERLFTFYHSFTPWRSRPLRCRTCCKDIQGSSGSCPYVGLGSRLFLGLPDTNISQSSHIFDSE